MPTEPQLRKDAAKTVRQTVSAVDAARTLSRQTGSMFDSVFGGGLYRSPTTDHQPQQLAPRPKQTLSLFGEIIGGMFGAVWTAVKWRGK